MATLPYEYSEKEIKLMETLKMLDIAKSPSTPPPMMYIWMAVQCFREHREDAISTSVRNCLLALDKPMDKTTPKRLTPEFDALIQF